MIRPINFGAGPSAFPEVLLKKAQQDFLNWNNSGISILETPHHSAAFIDLLDESTQNLRELLGIPSHYEILFITAPTRLQFSMIPMNFLKVKPQAIYIDSGTWSKQAIQEANLYGKIKAFSYFKSNFLNNYDQSDYAYLHYTDNETIDGIEFPDPPNAGQIPLIADMTSNLLTKTIDISRYSMIYAGTQKNIAPSGLTLVIIKENLLNPDNCLSITPLICRYKYISDKKSLHATPNLFSCYFANLMFKWIQENGGVKMMESRNKEKSQALYTFLNNSDLYQNNVNPSYRSRTNVVFSLAIPTLTELFLKNAEKANIIGIKGHSLKGGFRISLYNAITLSQVEYVIDFMKYFEKYCA